MRSIEPRFPNKLLFFGVLFILIGVLLQLWTTGYLPGFIDLWPVIFIILGFIAMYYVWVQDASEHYIFIGMFFILGGSYFLLINTVLSEGGIEQYWPFFMAITGISIIPYAMRKQGRQRMALIIPGVSITLLGLIFLIFSLDLVEISFRKFVIIWWPAFIILFGVILLALYLYKQQIEKSQKL